MSDQDHTPANVLAMQRDVLGCQVLCLTDHTEHLSCPEHAHVYDAPEREAGGLPVIYGAEPWGKPAHNIIYYAIDRGVFDALRQILWLDIDERDRARVIREELPERSVIAMRHSHGHRRGEYAAQSPRTVGLVNPRLEPGMEAMQTRGNMMMDKWRRNDQQPAPLFPNNFLHHDARLALVGGSDHSHGSGPNRFRLTGFWVRELSGQAV